MKKKEVFIFYEAPLLTAMSQVPPSQITGAKHAMWTEIQQFGLESCNANLVQVGVRCWRTLLRIVVSLFCRLRTSEVLVQYCVFVVQIELVSLVVAAKCLREKSKQKVESHL